MFSSSLGYPYPRVVAIIMIGMLQQRFVCLFPIEYCIPAETTIENAVDGVVLLHSDESSIPWKYVRVGPTTLEYVDENGAITSIDPDIIRQNPIFRHRHEAKKPVDINTLQRVALRQAFRRILVTDATVSQDHVFL